MCVNALKHLKRVTRAAIILTLVLFLQIELLFH